MALETTSLSQVPAPVNFVLIRALLRAANKTLPYFNGTLPGELQVSGGSASVKWRRIERLATATTALSEVTGTAAFGLGRTSVTPTITDITVAVAKYGNAILHSEEVDLFNVNSRSIQLMEELGVNAGESLNELMRDVWDGQTTDRFANQNTTDGGGVIPTTTASTVSPLSDNDVRESVRALNVNSAMKQFAQGTGSTNIGTSTVRQSYFGVCHSDVEVDVRSMSGFVPVEQYAGYTQTFVSEFGAAHGVRWSSTETAPLTSGAGTLTVTSSVADLRGATNILNDMYSTFIYGREAVGVIGLGEEHVTDIYMSTDMARAVELISHPPGSSGIGDMFNEAGSLAWKAWFAGKILQTLWIQKITSGATQL